MPETPEEIYERCRAQLVLPSLAAWETFPFAGEITLRPLRPPLPAEPPREGAGGVGCEACSRPDADYLWVDEHSPTISPQSWVGCSSASSVPYARWPGSAVSMSAAGAPAPNICTGG